MIIAILAVKKILLHNIKKERIREMRSNLQNNYMLQ